MSFIDNPSDLPIYIGTPFSQGTPFAQSWVFTWRNAGWQENTFVEPQPLQTQAWMSFTDPTVSLNPDGTYSFSFTVTNHGPEGTTYNLRFNNN